MDLNKQRNEISIFIFHPQYRPPNNYQQLLKNTKIFTQKLLQQSNLIFHLLHLWLPNFLLKGQGRKIIWNSYKSTNILKENSQVVWKLANPFQFQLSSSTSNGGHLISVPVGLYFIINLANPSICNLSTCRIHFFQQPKLLFIRCLSLLCRSTCTVQLVPNCNIQIQWNLNFRPCHGSCS
jgi:hypothetical protein